MAEERDKLVESGSGLRLLLLLAIAVACSAWTQSESNGFAKLLGASLVPALLAWVLVRKMPSRSLRAIVRGVGIELLLIGLIAFGSTHGQLVAQGSSLEAADTNTFNSKAGFLLLAGLILLVGSLFGEKSRNNNAQD